MTTVYIDPQGRRHVLRRAVQPGPTPRPFPYILVPTGPEPAEQKEKPMPTFTPSPTDFAEAKRMHERAKQLQIAQGLSYLEALMRASEQLARGDRVADPDRLLLHSMAQRYAVDHKVGYREALLAVGADYDRVAGGPAAKPAHIVAGEDLDGRTRLRMAAEPSLNYREALLIESAKTPARPSSKIGHGSSSTTDDDSAAIQDAKTHELLPTDDDVNAYAKKKGLTYKQALQELEDAIAAKWKTPDGQWKKEV